MSDLIARKRSLVLITGLLSLFLSACGGSGGGGSDSGGDTPSIQKLTTDCEGIYCGALGADAYAGTGVGVWTASNAGSTTMDIPVSISGANGKTATLIWTNLTGASQSTPSSAGALIQKTDEGDEKLARQRAALAQQREKVTAIFPALAKKKQANLLLSTLSAPKAYLLNDSKVWYDSINARSVSTSLRSQAILSSGRQANVWVEDSEWNGTGMGSSLQVSQAMADLLRERFATLDTGIHDMLTTLAGGRPWGTHSYPSDLIGASQDIHIIVSNLTRDQRAGGLLGYFDPANNFLATRLANSNEALLFFVDSESLAANPLWQNVIVSTLAHELVHMINFYQRTVLKSTGSSVVQYDTWLEEMTAMMAQDIVDTRLGSYHTLRDTWFPGWVASGAYNCNLTTYKEDEPCFSYDVGGSFSGYLLRQYGTGLFRSLAQSGEINSVTALDQAIRKYAADDGFAESLRRWGSAIALLDGSASPSRFGYPQRTETVGGVLYTLPAINGVDYASLRSVPALPSSLQPYAHAAQIMSITDTIFTRKVTIPAGTAFTLVIQ